MLPSTGSAPLRHPPDGITPARGRRPAGPRSGAGRTAALSLVMLLAGSGCTWIRGAPEPPPAPPPASASPPSSEAESPPVVPRDRTEEILAEGAAYLAIGDHSASRARFQYVLDRWEEEDGNGVEIPAELRARALWHLGLLHLLGEGPDRDEEQALSLLTRLSEEYPATPEGIQARWLRTLLQDLEGARRRGAEQEQRIRELNETVEQLRRIDLNRRPAPPRADTLQFTRKD
jgi:hypothetical protein